MTQINREEFLKNTLRYILCHAYISVPQIQKDFNVSYKDARLLVADLVSAGAVEYDRGMAFKVNKDFIKPDTNVKRGGSRSREEEKIDKNAISLCMIYHDMHFTKDEITKAMLSVNAEVKKPSPAKENTDIYEKQRKELMERLARLAQDDDDDDDDDEDEDEDIQSAIDELTQKSAEALMPIEYTQLSDAAKEALDRIVKSKADIDKLGIRMEVQRQLFIEKRIGGKTERYNELNKMLLSITDAKCQDMIKAILAKK